MEGEGVEASGGGEGQRGGGVGSGGGVGAEFKVQDPAGGFVFCGILGIGMEIGRKNWRAKILAEEIGTPKNLRRIGTKNWHKNWHAKN